eukprot:TRINITY_DN25959_c0_g2_i1.p1 TRINITY_DN25959_c0_g2~~TRINITY_DN25959_c0_g2_i1.p1  ORF type:complete len:236 (-),score=46.13 TRINITY_DN25959_c0_g2_i1:210-848(-)
MGCLGMVCCCVCCMCCALFAAVVVTAVYLAENLHEPSIGIREVAIRHLQFVPKVALDIDTSVWINNPNGWPFSGSILEAEGEVYSLDKSDASQPALHVGTAFLPQAVNIPEHQNTTFHIEMKSDVKTGDVALAARLMRDCHGFKSPETKIGVHMTKTKISFWQRTFDLPLSELNLTFNATVPCPVVGKLIDTTESNEMSSSQDAPKGGVVVV